MIVLKEKINFYTQDVYTREDKLHECLKVEDDKTKALWDEIEWLKKEIVRLDYVDEEADKREKLVEKAFLFEKS